MQKLFLTFFGAGYSKFAPGTVGSLVAMPFGLIVLYYLGLDSLVSIIIVGSIIAILEINKFEKNGGEHDDKSIVIDEALGVWLSMAFTFGIYPYIYKGPYGFYIALFLSFASFRLFDIWKPSTIGKIDKKVKGGLGVVGDDLLSGMAAGMLNLAIFKILFFASLYIK